MYSLMTHAIPHHLIPVTSEGKIKVKTHLEPVKMRGRKLGRIHSWGEGDPN
jgi:hypothetical protein